MANGGKSLGLAASSGKICKGEEVQTEERKSAIMRAKRKNGISITTSQLTYHCARKKGWRKNCPAEKPSL